jgi:general secretion pathway protein N
MAISKRFIAAGAATFIAGIILMFPARAAYTWFAPPEVRLSGISGTIWRGSATEGNAGGMYLRDLRWRFSPLSIFRANLVYAIETATAFGTINCDAGVTLSGNIVIRNLDSRFSLQEFRNQFQLQGFDGSLNLQLESLVLHDGVPIEAHGRVRLENLMARQLSPNVIGDYQADFTSDDSSIIGSVEELGGVLDVAGKITIDNDRNFSFIGKIAALPDAPSGLTDQLQLLGPADDRGYREFRIEGQL